MGGNCALQCFQGKSIGRIIPFVPLFCCVGNDLSNGGNRHSNQFFSRCVLFDVFIYYLPQQLKYIIPNSNFTVKQGRNILGKFYEGPPRFLNNPKLWLRLACLRNRPSFDEITHRPHLTLLIKKLGPWCFTQHASPSGHRFLSKRHRLERQVAGDKQIYTVRILCFIFFERT